MNKSTFIKPNEYTPTMGPAAIISLSDAKRFQELSNTRDERISEIERWLIEDESRGIVIEDEDVD